MGSLTCAAGVLLAATEPHELLHQVLGNLQVLVTVTGLGTRWALRGQAPPMPTLSPMLLRLWSGQGVSRRQRTQSFLSPQSRGYTASGKSFLTAMAPSGPWAASSSSRPCRALSSPWLSSPTPEPARAGPGLGAPGLAQLWWGMQGPASKNHGGHGHAHGCPAPTARLGRARPTSLLPQGPGTKSLRVQGRSHLAFRQGPCAGHTGGS